NSLAPDKPGIVAQPEPACFGYLSNGLLEGLVDLDGEVGQQVPVGPVREEPNLIVQAYPSLLNVGNGRQLDAKLLQLLCGNERITKLDANARLLGAARQDHLADQVVKSPPQVRLVAQLVGREVARGRVPRVR